MTQSAGAKREAAQVAGVVELKGQISFPGCPRLHGQDLVVPKFGLCVVGLCFASVGGQVRYGRGVSPAAMRVAMLSSTGQSSATLPTT